MALVDVTATGEDNILNTEQIEDLISDDLKYRNQQLKKLRDEVLDLEEMDESVSLTDFSLDDFRVELLNYINSNGARLESAPFGLYALVPSPSGEHAALTVMTSPLLKRKSSSPALSIAFDRRATRLATRRLIPSSPIFWYMSALTAPCGTTIPTRNRFWRFSASSARGAKTPTKSCARSSTTKRTMARRWTNTSICSRKPSWKSSTCSGSGEA